MLKRLYKCNTSGGGGCPSVYAEDGSFLVVGDRADQDPTVAAGLTDAARPRRGRAAQRLHAL